MQRQLPDYALMTAARNEADYIEGTIRSVLRQTHKPVRWVIVSDGSTDETDSIVQNYAKNNHFVVLERREEPLSGVDFGRKVRCLRHALSLLGDVSYSYIGNLDADVTFGAEYFETLLKVFQKNPKLGIAGGRLFEPRNGRFLPRYLSEDRYVPGAVQFFRRECFQQVGGYIPSRWGGEDTIAVVAARMKGWKTASIDCLKVFHHKVSESARGWAHESFREGAMFYALGSHPLFELLKCLRWTVRKPVFLQAAVRLYGYAWAAWHREERPVSPELVCFLRSEQRTRVMRALHGFGR